MNRTEVETRIWGHARVSSSKTPAPVEGRALTDCSNPCSCNDIAPLSILLIRGALYNHSLDQRSPLFQSSLTFVLSNLDNTLSVSIFVKWDTTLKITYFCIIECWFLRTLRINTRIIIHWTHYLFSDWPKAYSEFSKSAPGTSSSCRLYNNHVKDTQGHG